MGSRGADTSMTVAPAAAGDARSAESTAIFSGVSLALPQSTRTPSRRFIVTVSCVRAETSPTWASRSGGQLLEHAQHGAERPLVPHRHVDHRQPLGRGVDPADLDAVHVEQREAGAAPCVAALDWLRDRGHGLAGDEHHGEAVRPRRA